MLFQAACWFFAQELTDIAVDKNATPPVLGMIQSAWGGTQIEDWQRNDTIANCKNASGTGPISNRGKQAGKVYPDNGALWNGMVAPFINYTIFGALWYTKPPIVPVPFFKMVPKNLDLRCVFLPALFRVKNTSRIQN